MTITINIDPDKEKILQRHAELLGLPIDQYVSRVIDEDIAQHAITDSNAAARELLKQWLADESGYDDEAWPKAEKAIEENRLSERRRFRD